MRMHICRYFGVMRNIQDKNKKNRSVRDHILKYLAKRKTISQKYLQIKDERDDPTEIQNGSFLYPIRPTGVNATKYNKKKIINSQQNQCTCSLTKFFKNLFLQIVHERS